MVYRTAPVELGANPLVNDDQYLNPPGTIEFGGSPAGLDLSMGQLPPLGMELTFDNAASDPGVQAIMRTANMPQPVAQPQQQRSQIFYSPSTGDIVVNGYQFNERNASNALESEAWARQPARQFQLPDTVDDWREMSPDEYSSYIDSIRNPGVGRRVSEAWEHAWRSFGDVNIGAGLAAAEAVGADWEWGRVARENLAREFHENAPFMVGLRDIENPGDASIFAMQMSIQAVPWVVETIAAMVVGGVVGGVVSGGVGAPAGAVEGLIVREGLRRAASSVISSRLRSGAAAYSRILSETGASQLTRQQALRSAAASEVDDLNRFYDFSERLYHFSRGADNANMLGSWGARLGAASTNYAAAVGDIRNSIEDAGGDPTTATSIANIWGGAIPYALMETFGDLIWTAPLSRTLPEVFQGGRGLAGRAANAGLVGVSEGFQEMGQYGITQQAVANVMDTPLEIDPIDLLEQGLGGFFGGAAVGGVLGGHGPAPESARDTGTTLPINPDPIDPGPRPDPFFEVDPETEDPFAGVMALDPLSVPGAGTGVAMGDLYVPETAGVPTPPNAMDDTYIQPDFEIPGQVDSLGEPLVPGQPSAVRTPGWPPPAPPNLSTEFPQRPNDDDMRAPTGTELQEIMRREAVDDAVNVVARRNPRLGRLFRTVLQATQEGLFIDPNLTNELPLIEQEAMSEGFPAQHQATTMLLPQEMQRLIIAQNRRAIQELINLLQDGRNVLTWSKEKLERYQALAGSALIKAKDGFSPEQRKQIGDMQGLVFDVLNKRKTVPVQQNEQGGKKRSEQRKAARERARAEVDAAKAAIKATQESLTKEDLKRMEREKDEALRRSYEGMQAENQVSKADKLKKGEKKSTPIDDQLRGRRSGTMDDAVNEQFPTEPQLEPTAAAEYAPMNMKDDELVNYLWDGGSEENNAIAEKQLSNYPRVRSTIVRFVLPYEGMPSKVGDTFTTDKMTSFTSEAQANSGHYFIENLKKQPGVVKMVVENPQNAAGVIGKVVEALYPSGQTFEVVRVAEDGTLYLEERNEVEAEPQQDPDEDNEPVSEMPKSDRLKESARRAAEQMKAQPKPDPKLKSTLNENRVEAGYKKLVETSKDLLKEPAQRVRKYIQTLGDGKNPGKETREWAELNGKLLTIEEARAIEAMFPPRKQKAPPPKRTGGLTKAERQVRRFAVDVLEEFKNSKSPATGTPEMFAQWVRENASVAQAWLDTAEQPGERGARSAVEKILKSSPTQASMNPGQTGQERRGQRLWELIQQIGLKTPSKLNKIQDPYFPTDWREQIARMNATDPLGFPEFRNVHEVSKTFRSVSESNTEIGKTFRATAYLRPWLTDKAKAMAADDIRRAQLERDVGLLPIEDNVVPFKKPTKVVKADPNNNASSISFDQVKAIVAKIQKTITPRGRFRTVHIFKNFQDLVDRRFTETMIASNGAEITMDRWMLGITERMKLEHKELRILTHEQMLPMLEKGDLDFRGAVVNGFDALIVFSDAVKSERDLLSVLEHEYIVHKGLRAVFPNDVDREAFLKRALLIPGMDKRIKALTETYPAYKSYTIYEQVEEVIAFHSMDGPLALEQLLKADEGIDQQTRRTLWEDLKDMVRKWIAKFYPNNDPFDRAMDDFVAGLREHAITGSMQGFNDSLMRFSTMKIDPDIVDRLKAGMRRSDIVATATVSTPLTPEEYRKLLYGYDETAGRAYTPTPWTTKMRSTLESNMPTAEKFKELAKRAGTTDVKEWLRAVGRNVETMNNMGERSVLVQKLMQMMHRTIHTAREQIESINETRIYARKTKQADPLNGSTQDEREGYNKMAALATNAKMPKVSEQQIQAHLGLITKDVTGALEINEPFAEELVEKGVVPIEEFKGGMETYTVTPDGELVSQGKQTLPAEMIDASYHKIYVPETKHMARSAIAELKHALIMLNEMNDVVVQDLVRDIKVSIKDEAFFEESLKRINRLYADIAFHQANTSTVDKIHTQLNKARQVMVELMRAYWVPDKVKDWIEADRKPKDSDPRSESAFKWRDTTHEDVKPFAAQINWFLENDPATGKPRIARMGELGVTDTQQYNMLNAFQNIITTEMDVRQRERQTIQSILGNYVEFARRGKWRVYVEVLDAKTGKRADIGADLITSLPIVYPENENQADVLRQQLQDAFEGTYKINNVDGNPIEIKFNVKQGRAPGTATLAEAPNVKQFLDVARIINLKLTAPQMKEIANLIENAGGRRRFGLKRAGIPGYDADILKSNSEVMTRRAWTGAKMSQSWALNRLFDDRKNLYGDMEHLEELQRNFDIANRGAPEGQPVPSNFVRNEADVYYAEKALLMYANQMKHMMETSKHQTHVIVRTTTGTKKLKIEPEAQAHLDHAKALRESIKRGDLELNLNDLLSKTGPLRMAAVAMQLGSIASGIMQAFSLFTHLPVLLTAKHHRTAYGEGYDVSEVMAGLMTATGQTARHLFVPDTADIHKLLEQVKAGANIGIDKHELAFIYQEILTGVLAPQQTYSMTGGTESNIPFLWLRNLAEYAMMPFSKFESGVRRAAALLIYRLAKARYIRAGVSEAELNDPTSKAYAKLVEDVRRPIFQSQGDYANINRSKILRGDIGQYFGMYKMFPIMTQIMIYNLPLQNQLAFLGIMFLLGGLKGEPFADDFMDIYDTLLQKMGFQHDSVELQLIQMFEEIMPGSSKWIMTGFVDTVAFGGTMSTRISMGDIIPGTGIFRDDADLHREMTSLLGPAYASNIATLEWAWLATDFTLQVMGIKNQTNNWEDLIRTMPQAQLRGVGEAILMARDGSISDSRGRLVSDEVTPASIFMRALGFYPLEATQANTAVRLDRMHLGYMRAVRARYVLAYANAYRAGDQERMDRIAEDVRRWNEAAEETGQEDMKITNFRSAGVRAGRAASQTTVERASESAPSYSVIDEVAAALTADEESDED